MKIGKRSVVSMDYELHLGDGEIIDRSTPEQPLVYVHGESQIVPGLEQALEGLSVGDARQVVVAPVDGYGERDERGLQVVPRDAFPAELELKPGAELYAHGPEGEPVAFVVREVQEKEVVVDFNHPLAGKPLHFSVKILGVREATDEEIEELNHDHTDGCCSCHEDH